MFKKKMMKVATVSIVALSLGGAVLSVGATNVSAKTVVSQTAKETVIIFTKADIEKATGVNLTLANVQKTYNSLTKTETWKSLGYNDAQAKKIAQRVSSSSRQAQGILKDMVSNAAVQFKVVYVNTGWNERVNIGSEKVAGQTPEIEKPSATTPEVERPTTSGLDSNIKELEIDAEYKQDNKDIELDVDVKDDGRVKAEFENEATRTKLKGTQAEAIAVDIFKGINVKNMSKDQIKNHVLTKLGADKNTKQFKFKVKYFDGTKIDFKIK